MKTSVVLPALALLVNLGAARAKTPAPVEPWLTVRVVAAPVAAGSALRVTVLFSTTQHFSCLGYSVPARLKQGAGRFVITLGEVQAPRGPCPTALGPAGASVVLPDLPEGRYPIELRDLTRHGRGAQADLYTLRIEGDEVELMPVRARSTTSMGIPALHRVPTGAVTMTCGFRGWEQACKDAQRTGGLTCERFFADPVIAALPMIPRRGPYLNGFFDSADKIFQVQDLDALRAHLERAYRDPTACVNIRVYSWRGEVLANPVGPAPPP